MPDWHELADKARRFMLIGGLAFAGLFILVGIGMALMEPTPSDNSTPDSSTPSPTDTPDEFELQLAQHFLDNTTPEEILKGATIQGDFLHEIGVRFDDAFIQQAVSAVDRDLHMTLYGELQWPEVTPDDIYVVCSYFLRADGTVTDAQALIHDWLTWRGVAILGAMLSGNLYDDYSMGRYCEDRVLRTAP